LNESQEAALVRHCQAGDKEAFHTLVEQYRSVLFGTAYLMVRDRGLADVETSPIFSPQEQC
jgi:DNA-directed RNA polymerase specialized sigma24 family protein